MASASGKVILLGEHVVVYDAPALAVGIDRGALATAMAGDSAKLVVGERSASPTDGTELGKAYGALLESVGATDLRTTVELTLPPGVGLGASAAIGVAAAGALLELTEPHLRGQELTDRLFEAAMCWERVFHGNPSGIDAAAAAHAGCIFFTRRGGIEPVRVDRDMHLVIAIAGPPASTKMMVDGVARLRDRSRALVDKSVEGVTSLVKNARLAIEAGDFHGLGKLLDLNQMILAGLFLSTEGIENACAIAREAGALGAKLTGAGGGGCVIALVDEDPEPVLKAWRNADIECFETVVTASPEASP